MIQLLWFAECDHESEPSTGRDAPTQVCRTWPVSLPGARLYAIACQHPGVRLQLTTIPLWYLSLVCKNMKVKWGATIFLTTLWGKDLF
jgi:hypothetical protein